MFSRPKSRRPLALACLFGASAAVAFADGRMVMVDGGAIKIGVTSPAPQDLSSGASLNVPLPAGSVKAQATAAVGGESDHAAVWQKSAAQVEAQISGPLGSNLAITGRDYFGFTYRAPNTPGAADTASHMVRSETRTANASVSLPAGPAQVTLGGEGNVAATQDTDKGLGPDARAVIRTEDQALFAKGEWQPVSALHLEAGASARNFAISWRQQQARTSTFRSLDPHVSAGVTPWNETTVTARFEHKVAPYDAAAFAGYAASNPAPAAPAFEPDHAWQLEMQLQQKIGSAQLSATYSAERNGTITEFAEQNGRQVPAATRLEKLDNLALSLNLPLSSVGLPNTALSSQAEWRSSQVLDPLTQKLRPASGEVPGKFSLRMAHEMPREKLSFGITGKYAEGRTSYQVNEISNVASGASIGAFVAFNPGPYVLDFNINGLCGGTSSNTYFPGSRAASQSGRTVVQDNSGALFNLSLHKPL